MPAWFVCLRRGAAGTMTAPAALPGRGSTGAGRV